MSNSSSRKRQLALDFKSWGGARQGAGRKRPKGVRRRVAHVIRPDVSDNAPLHVTLRLAAGLPSLRRARTFRVVRRALATACARFGVRITDWSVMTNHLHLIVEAPDKRELSRAMQGLGIRLARRLNGVWRRRGKVFDGRYHARALTTPLEVRRGLAYVLNNARRHAARGGHRYPKGWLDPYSTGVEFEGWREQPVPSEYAICLDRAPPSTWLRREGWRKHGLIPIAELPRPWLTR